MKEEKFYIPLPRKIKGAENYLINFFKNEKLVYEAKNGSQQN